MTPPEPPQLLTSWKEIAAYFGRDVRTVQRWEREGLPVHRRPGAERSGVFAYRSELEAWLSGRLPDKEDAGISDEVAATDEAVRTASADGPRSTPVSLPLLRSRGFALGAVAAVFVIALFSLIAVRAGEPRRPDTAVAVLAASETPLMAPRWANLDGAGGDDVVINQTGRGVLLFLTTSRSCDKAIADCADVRITGGSDCSLYSGQSSDFNADGLDDIAVTCSRREPASFHGTGSTFLLWGRAAWPRDVVLPRDADVTLRSTATFDERTHTCLRSQPAPDVNADGIADLMLGSAEAGAGEYGASGSLRVFFGRRDWPRTIVIQESDVAIHGAYRGEGFGGVCATGDVDGDGLEEIAGVADDARLWKLRGRIGRTYVLRNQGAWPRTIHLANHPSFVVEGRHADTIGRQVRLADLDGDRRAEIVISEPRAAGSPVPAALIGIWRGGALNPGSTTVAGAPLVIEGAFDSDLGESLDAVDIDGDARYELVADQAGRGNILLFSEFASARVRASAGMTVAGYPAQSGDEWSADLVAARGGRIAHAVRTRGKWSLAVRELFRHVDVDVRPNSSEDVLLRPGAAVVAFVGSASALEPIPETIRAAGARPVTHRRADINGDRIPDLLAYFETNDMRLAEGVSSILVSARDANGVYLRAEPKVTVITPRNTP